MKTARITHIDVEGVRSGLRYARNVLHEASIAGRLFGFSDRKEAVTYLREATGIIHGYIELAAALRIREKYGRPLYVREIADLGLLSIDRRHLTNVPKISVSFIEEPPVSDFVLWNGRLLKFNERFLPYFAGPGLADVEVYEHDSATLYYITTGGEETMIKERQSMKKHSPSFPVHRVQKIVYRFRL